MSSHGILHRFCGHPSGRPPPYAVESFGVTYRMMAKTTVTNAKTTVPGDMRKNKTPDLTSPTPAPESSGQLPRGWATVSFAGDTTLSFAAIVLHDGCVLVGGSLCFPLSQKDPFCRRSINGSGVGEGKMQKVGRSGTHRRRGHKTVAWRSGAFMRLLDAVGATLAQTACRLINHLVLWVQKLVSSRCRVTSRRRAVHGCLWP